MCKTGVRSVGRVCVCEMRRARRACCADSLTTSERRAGQLQKRPYAPAAAASSDFFAWAALSAAFSAAFCTSSSALSPPCRAARSPLPAAPEAPPRPRPCLHKREGVRSVGRVCVCEMRRARRACVRRRGDNSVRRAWKLHWRQWVQRAARGARQKKRTARGGCIRVLVAHADAGAGVLAALGALVAHLACVWRGAGGAGRAEGGGGSRTA